MARRQAACEYADMVDDGKHPTRFAETLGGNLPPGHLLVARQTPQRWRDDKNRYGMADKRAKGRNHAAIRFGDHVRVAHVNKGADGEKARNRPAFISP